MNKHKGSTLDSLFEELGELDEVKKLTNEKIAEELKKLDQLPIIYADFNARTENGLVRLDTVGSKKSLATVKITPGMLVRLSDGEVDVLARIETMDTASIID